VNSFTVPSRSVLRPQVQTLLPVLITLLSPAARLRGFDSFNHQFHSIRNVTITVTATDPITAFLRMFPSLHCSRRRVDRRRNYFCGQRNCSCRMRECTSESNAQRVSSPQLQLMASLRPCRYAFIRCRGCHPGFLCSSFQRTIRLERPDQFQSQRRYSSPRRRRICPFYSPLCRWANVPIPAGRKSARCHLFPCLSRHPEQRDSPGRKSSGSL